MLGSTRVLHPAPSIQHPAPSTQHPAPSTQHPAPSTQHPAPSTQHPAVGCWDAKHISTHGCWCEFEPPKPCLESKTVTCSIFINGMINYEHVYWPRSTSVMAFPACCPGIKLVRMALTWGLHGHRMAPGTDSTTTVLACALATAAWRSNHK